MARRKRRNVARRPAAGRRRTTRTPAKRKAARAVGRRRTTGRRSTTRRRRRGVSGATVGFAKFLSRDIQGVVMNGAVAAVSATASPYIVGQAVGSFAPGVKALAAGSTGRRLANIAFGIGSAFAILKLTKKRDIALAWATGPVVMEGSALLSGLLPTGDVVATEGYMGSLMPAGDIPAAISSQYQNVAGMMAQGSGRPELGVRAA